MRLLTQVERAHIIDVCRNAPEHVILRKKGLFLLLYVGFSVFAFVYTYLEEKDHSVAVWVGIVTFLILMAVTAGILIPYTQGIKKIPSLLESGEMLVEEAVYDKTSRRFFTTYVYISEGGRQKYKGINFTHMENFSPGDRILILRNRGFKWAFRKV